MTDQVRELFVAGHIEPKRTREDQILDAVQAYGKAAYTQGRASSRGEPFGGPTTVRDEAFTKIVRLVLRLSS